VIGDDGVEGILIGNGDATGEAYLHIQRMALELRSRGVVLVVSSKNEDEVARLPFRTHPDMLLKEEHFAEFQANWLDKASNIKLMSEKLSLGLDSFVFLDDNPAERMQVRRELPSVAVPELPDDPALYVSTLLAAGYFEALSFSQEDQQRADFYSANSKRELILKSASNMDEYLNSLEMEVIFQDFDSIGRARIFQLVSKSNQFNLTTKRYTESQIRDFEDDSAFFTRQIRLTDCFGDNGMISVVLCEIKGQDWIIETWLMSCRVLGRKVELAVLQDLIGAAKRQGGNKLIGIYRPSDRNMIVKDHYKLLGFEQVSMTTDEQVWELDISDYVIQDIPMRVSYAI